MEGDADSFMTSIKPTSAPQPSSNTNPLSTNEPHRVQGDDHYEAQRNKLLNPGENNTETNNTMDFSTPLSDIMEPPQMMPPMGAGPGPSEDPRASMMAPSVPAPQMFVSAPAPPPTPQNTNPGNLTDDQPDAVIILVIVAALMSPVGQNKLAQFAPTFADRGLGGLIAMGALAAATFYITKKFILKK